MRKNAAMRDVAPKQRRRLLSKRFSLQGFVALLMAGLFLSALGDVYAAEKMNPRHEAEQWEEVAKIRLQAARGHELQAERRRENAFRFTGGLTASADALDLAGDDKYLASDDYRMASKHWEKAAKAYRAAGEPDKAKDALENAATTMEAAKRALREGADLYKLAEDQFDSVNNLDRKIQVLKKSARNIERLMEMR